MVLDAALKTDAFSDDASQEIAEESTPRSHIVRELLSQKDRHKLL
jgi:hypothetical protein